MSGTLRSTLTQKRWLAWLLEHSRNHRILRSEEELILREQLNREEHRWGRALSFEVAEITAEDAIHIVSSALCIPAVAQIGAWIGNASSPLAIVLPLESLGQLLTEAARWEDPVTIAALSGDGRATISLPLANQPGELLISGTGLFEGAVRKIGLAYPTGLFFRGN